MKYYGAVFKDREVYILTELMEGGDLSTIISGSDAPLSWLVRCKLAKDALSAIAYLHQNEVVHRDIKTENFLVSREGRRRGRRGREEQQAECGSRMQQGRIAQQWRETTVAALVSSDNSGRDQLCYPSS